MFPSSVRAAACPSGRRAIAAYFSFGFFAAASISALLIARTKTLSFLAKKLALQSCAELTVHAKAQTLQRAASKPAVRSDTNPRGLTQGNQV